MKKALIISLVMLCSAAVAFAQDGEIGLWADANAGSCNLNDTNIGGFSPNFNVYVVHTGIVNGAGGSQWSAPAPACGAGHFQYNGETPTAGMTPDGNSQTGIGLGYGGCYMNQVMILTINCLTAEDTPTCCTWCVEADPRVASGLIEGSDCDFALTHPTGKCSPFNEVQDQACDCDAANPVEQRTWGNVKALWNTEN